MSTDDSGGFSSELLDAVSRCTATIAEGRIVPALRDLREVLSRSQGAATSTERIELLSRFAAMVLAIENSLVEAAAERLKEIEAQVVEMEQRQRLERPNESGVDRVCSFCGKRHDEVVKLFEGPKAVICNECVALCNEILKSEEKRATQHRGA